MRAHSMRLPPFARRSTMGTTDRSKKRSRRYAARPRSDGITTRLSCSFNFLVIREEISSFFEKRFDLRHYNAHSRLSPSLAMHKTGQWCCLIQVKAASAVSSSASYAHWRASLREGLQSLQCSGRAAAMTHVHSLPAEWLPVSIAPFDADLFSKKLD